MCEVGGWPQRQRPFGSAAVVSGAGRTATNGRARAGEKRVLPRPDGALGDGGLAPGVEILGCELPDDCRVDLENDVWWRWEPDGRSARIGLLASLAFFAGRFHQVSYRPLTGELPRGRSVATVESTRYTGAVRVPVDVEVLDRNPELPEHPRWLNDRPYSDGWVARVRPVRPEDVPRFLETPEAVRGRLEETIRTRNVRCWPKFPDAELLEVGSECSAVLVRLNEELERRAPGETVLLVTDDPTSPIEMVRWTDRTGHPVIAQRGEGSIYRFLVEKLERPVPRRRPG